LIAANIGTESSGALDISGHTAAIPLTRDNEIAIVDLEGRLTADGFLYIHRQLVLCRYGCLLDPAKSRRQPGQKISVFQHLPNLHQSTDFFWLSLAIDVCQRN